MVAWMSGRKRDLCVTSSPPGFNSLKNAFFVGYQGRGRSRDVRGGCGAGGQGGDKGGGGVGGIPTGEFQHVSVNVFQKFKHAKLVHCHYQRSFDFKVHLSNEARKDCLLRGWGDVGGHETKVGVLKICVPESVKRGTNVEERVDGKGECGGAEIVREFFNVIGVWEVVTEGMGV